MKVSKSSYPVPKKIVFLFHINLTVNKYNRKVKSMFLKSKYPAIIFVISAFVFSSSAFAQQNNRFSIERTIAGYPQKVADKNAVTYNVLENDNVKYVINIALDYDVPVPALKVFSDGSAVLINAFEASLTFYNKSGIEFYRTNLLKEFKVHYERAIYSALSGEFLVIVISQPGLDNMEVQIYNNSGQQINSFRVEAAHINGLCYSSTKNLVALSVYDWPKAELKKSTLFFNNEGEEISKIPFNFNDGKFIEDINLFIGYSNQNCFVYNISDHTLNFDKPVQNDEMILSADLFEEKIIIVKAARPVLQSGKWYYKDPTFSYYSLSGMLSRELQHNSQPFADFKWRQKNSKLEFQTENEVFEVNK